MEVKIKIVVFKHPEPQTWGQYCGYCSSNGYFCSGKDASDISNKILGVLTFELQQRKNFLVIYKKGVGKYVEIQ